MRQCITAGSAILTANIFDLYRFSLCRRGFRLTFGRGERRGRTELESQQGPAAKQGGRPTLRAIAYITGLGVTTVSRALHDAPDIGRATKDRVRLVARRSAIGANRAGVRLRTGKTNVISLVLSVESEILG